MKAAVQFYPVQDVGRVPGDQSGICSVVLFIRIRSPAGGLAEIGGTFAAVIGVAIKVVNGGVVGPRGVVRTTWLGGNGVPFFR